jgi:uncharacterized surface protein with fasciclin (FAS1) repeats
MSNITQVVNDNENMTTLKKGVIASGLDKVLSGTGPYTVFAPSDLAFRKMDTGKFETLLKPENKTELKDILNCHIVSGKVGYNDLKAGKKLKTINGQQLSIEVRESRVQIEGAEIEARDLETSNGVIHVLDTVMIKN